MARMFRKLEKALMRHGYRLERKDGHLLTIRLTDGRVTCDMDLTGMDQDTLRSNVELLLLVVTQ